MRRPSFLGTVLASVLGITGDPSRNVAGRIEALDPATRAKISWEAPPSETGASTTAAKDSEPKIAPSDCLFGVDDAEAGQRVDGEALPREAAAPSGEAEQPVPLLALGENHAVLGAHAGNLEA